MSNGGQWGKWSKRVDCPAGTKAIGFNLKVEEETDRFLDLIKTNDETGLNGIQLICSDNSEN